MKVGILAEKPDAAKRWSKALGGQSGVYNGENYAVVAAVGHIYEFADPHDMVPENLKEKYYKWDLANLPWNLNDLNWKRKIGYKKSDVAKQIKAVLKDCDEIVIATDVDPTGEGDMIAIEILEELGLDKGKKYSRAYFVSDTPNALREAFTKRKVIPSLAQHPEYKKAYYRSQFDLSSMQWSRVASKLGDGRLLRQGRLKSAMVVLVGDQLDKYNAYVKKPFYQNRFRDENGVMYTNKAEPMFENKNEVPTNFTDSRVVLDERSNKRTSPPKLLNLATLGSKLASATGLPAKKVLEIYQAMYEAQIVSYPRTDDKTITFEQFEEMLPLVDKIATVVGVDTKLLTHREPRSTHVKDQGAHGANRPGLNVPNSLSELDKFGNGAQDIYIMLAKSFLSMFGEDYVYESQAGHVEKYPAFVGTASVPKSMGYKLIFDADADKKSEDENAKGLGENASPIIHEGFPPRPAHPSQTWLMEQLDKRDVGTGATRLSTYADVTTPTKIRRDDKKVDPNNVLLKDMNGKKTVLGDPGRMSYLLLPGTHIGDLALTERIYANMRDIEAGKLEGREALKSVAKWVTEDMEIMRRNAVAMRKELNMSEQIQVEYVTGEFEGREVRFKKVWSDHTFTDDEIAKLLAGEFIEFQSTSKNTGNTYTARGRLKEGEFNGKPTFGFQLEFDNSGSGGVPKSFSKYTFSDAERAKLEAGEVVEFGKVFESKAGKKYSAKLKYGDKPGENRKGLIFVND